MVHVRLKDLSQDIAVDTNNKTLYTVVLQHTLYTVSAACCGSGGGGCIQLFVPLLCETSTELVFTLIIKFQ